MDENEYNNYLNNIEKYLNSGNIEEFTSKYFSQVIVQQVLKENA